MAQCETMSVIVPSKDVSSSGTISVSVANASVVSNSATFTVMTSTTGSGAPAIINFSPMAAPAGGTPFPLTIAALHGACGATGTVGPVGVSVCETKVTVAPEAKLRAAIGTGKRVPPAGAAIG